MKRVGFLFNHDAAHQVAHLAGIMRELAFDGSVDVAALVSKPAVEGVAGKLAGDASARIDWVRLEVSFGTKATAPALDRLFPFSRLMALHQNLDLFRDLDALVSTERTCLRIKDELGPAGPKFIYVPHGSGDRNVAYHPDLARFDLWLVSGQKLVGAALRAGVLGKDGARIIGYPKFDGVDMAVRPKLFDNDNPVFLYNPHFDPHISSVYTFGDAILDMFARHPEWNLIFAPHVMYWKKRLHVSLEFRTARWRRRIDPRFERMPNILIDHGSTAAIDMTYTRAADVYIGDVSSQIYEFLAVPRAAFFVDSHDVADWQGHENYQFWRNGPVVKTAAELEKLLPERRLVAEEYRATQQELFAYTIDRTGHTASARGAAAILDYMRAQ